MGLATIDWWVIGVFLLIFLGVAFYFARSANGNQNFFLGGRHLPWYLLGTSMVATTFAADTPLAVTELVAKHGISGNWLWWNMLSGGMLTTFFFARYWRRAGILTDVELISIRYSGRAARWLRGFKAIYMGAFLNVLIIGWVNLALITLIKVFFNLDDITAFWIMLAAMLMVITYSTASGLLGIVYTDTLQFIAAMTGSVFLSIWILDSPEIGGLQGLTAQLPVNSFQFFPNVGISGAGEVLALNIGSFLAFITVQWWASWYPGNEPGGGGYIAQRMMSARNEAQAVYASLLFQIAHYCIRPWPWILVALASVVLYPDLADSKEGYVLVMRDYLPDGLRGLLLVAFLSAYMSTISTQLNWGASYLVNDFYEPWKGKTAGTSAARWSTVLIAIIAAWVTTQIQSISAVWQFLMECGAGLGLVLILRWYWWRINAWSEIVATLAPFIGYSLAHYLFNWVFPQSFFFTVGFTTLAWLTATFLTAPTESHVLEAFQKRVQPAGWWPNAQNDNLGELAALWILAVVMAYGSLFSIGSFLFNQPEKWYYLVFTVCALAGFLFLMKRMKFH